MIEVVIEKERPDFRVMIDLIYGHGHKVDTDGDSFKVFSRTWTELYIKDRESDDPAIEIYVNENSPNIFEVKCEDEELEKLAALYLFLYCGLSMKHNGALIDEHHIEALKGEYATNLSRANNSVWHSSCESNPYPNIA